MLRDDLEAALAASWTRGNLAVYADHLLTTGDPRGEWIGLDLQLLRDGTTPELHGRRNRILRRYPAAKLNEARFELGFVDQVWLHPKLLSGRGRVLEIARELFGSLLGRYVRGVLIRGEAEWIAAIVTAIAAAPRPWLRHIGFHVLGRELPIRYRAFIEAELSAQLIAAAPGLELFAFTGTRDSTADRFDHPVAGKPQRLERIGPTQPSELVVEGYPGAAPATVGLAALERLHAATVDRLSPEAREAWADLRLVITRCRSTLISPPATPFPTATLAQIVAEIDPSSFYGGDWAGIRAALRATKIDTVAISCV